MSEHEPIPFVFPGQNARDSQLLQQIDTNYPIVKRIYEEASEAADENILALCLEDPGNKLRHSRFAQPATLTTSYVCYKVVTEELPDNQRLEKPDIVAGQSLGEYTALVVAGALDFGPAIRLVTKRGRLLDEDSAKDPATMIALLGWDLNQVEELCLNSETEVAIINSFDQIVIAGRKPHINKAKTLIDQQRSAGKKILYLDIGIDVASHCSLESDVAQKLSVDINAAKIKDPKTPFIANVTGEYTTTAEEIKALLITQLTDRVLWLDTILKMLNAGVTTIYEIGPSDILTKLSKRIMRTTGHRARALSTTDILGNASKDMPQ